MAEFNVDVIMGLVGQEFIGIVNELAVDIGGGIIRGEGGGVGTPVDTGHARHNWVLAFGAPDLNERPGVDISGEYAVNAIRTKLLVNRQRNPFTLVWISNNVPYILKLNEGYSQQAPAGYIEDNIRQAILNTGANRTITL